MDARKRFTQTKSAITLKGWSNKTGTNIHQNKGYLLVCLASHNPGQNNRGTPCNSAAPLPNPNLQPPSRVSRRLAAASPASDSQQSSNLEVVIEVPARQPSFSSNMHVQHSQPSHLPLHTAEELFEGEIPPSQSLGNGLMYTMGFVPGTGNCQFAALSLHVYGHLRSAATIRKKVVQYLRSHRSLVTDFAAEGDGHLGALPYIRKMSKANTWGDELTLLAASLSLKLPLAVASRSSGQLTFSYYPDNRQADYAGLFHMGNHYELLYVEN